MKKVMVVMAIVVALSFLVPVVAVAPAFAKQATQPKGSTATPTSSQRGTIQTSVIKQKPKEKFWELGIWYCAVNNEEVFPSSTGSPPDNCCHATVKVGQTTKITCRYTLTTPHLSSITVADVAAWGTGKSYKVTLFYPDIATIAQEVNRQLPQFTWAMVQQRQSGGQGNNPMQWSLSVQFTLTPPVQADTNQIKFFAFGLDGDDAIKETNEQNNLLKGWFKVLP